MLNRIYTYTLLACASLFFVQCDIVKDPRVDIITTPVDTSSTVMRKVLIEDYTGQSCGNCPVAAIKLDDIQALYGEAVVGMAVHAGFFADTLFFGHPTYGVILKNDHSTEYDNFFEVSLFGNPNGMVNRTFNDANSNNIYNHEKWAEITTNLIQEEAKVSVEISTTYNSSTRALEVTVSGESLDNLIGNHLLAIALTETNIVGPQKYYAGVLGYEKETWVDDYTHKHVLRDMIGGTWGESVLSDVEPGASYSKTVNYTIPTEFNADNCSIVAYVYNDNTKEILQVEEEHVN